MLVEVELIILLSHRNSETYWCCNWNVDLAVQNRCLVSVCMDCQTVRNHIFFNWRGVAQPGSASALGAEGRWFESSLPDQLFQ